MLKKMLHDVNRTRLEQLAARALSRGYRLADILIVCIDVDDPVWRPLVDEIMPGHDWERVRRTEGSSIARGSVMRKGVAEYVALVVPDIAHALRQKPRPGTVHAVICAQDGATVYEIEPRAEAN